MIRSLKADWVAEGAEMFDLSVGLPMLAGHCKHITHPLIGGGIISYGLLIYTPPMVGSSHKKIIPLRQSVLLAKQWQPL